MVSSVRLSLKHMYYKTADGSPVMLIQSYKKTSGKYITYDFNFPIVGTIYRSENEILTGERWAENGKSAHTPNKDLVKKITREEFNEIWK